MTDFTPFINRLKKNTRHISKWARRRGISCYRLYDRDIPEFPLAVDWYEGRVHLQEFAKQSRSFSEQANELATAIADALDISAENIVFKTRERQRGLSQYEKSDEQSDDFVVQEDGLRFLVNLQRYLDTGLFLDHRQTRAMVRELARDKRFLNLFAYTGSFTVYAAAGSATTSVTVDLSNTYQDWSKRNFELNAMDLDLHRLVREDVFGFLEKAASKKERFDLIVMDPPSFSNSKKMKEVLDVQRDHLRLIRGCLEILNPKGELFFSNNLKRFRLDPEIEQFANIEDISTQTQPEDFKRHKPHHCWRISHK
ncbi:class I SAM-dependent methyltransferase [Solemya velesiana gill symbiont]|uniref:Oxidoreductase n=1 Tax=Solemya velesiana gill symbiont TaxID=1918948 RepID=A0A1T2KXG2_9GAMM|nr:class I SAM-dependent methyltransferase [Solemya velesiana gill symbiont]OOZ37512.1 oxidoreductase [Solemya velesiana gill symbiont]